MLLSLKENISAPYDVIVFYYDLSENDLKFLECHFGCKTKLYEIQTDMANKTYTHMAYSIFECLDLLETYRKVLWLDTDIIVNDSIDGLFSFNNGLCAYFHRANMGFKFVDGVIPGKPRRFTSKTPFFNSGVVLFNDNIKKPQKIMKWCYKYAGKYHKNFLGGDQGVLNLAIDKFKVQKTNIGPKYNYLTFQKWLEMEEVKPSIIHFAQHPKPWERGGKDLYGDELMQIWNRWNYHYKKLMKEFGERCSVSGKEG